MDRGQDLGWLCDYMKALALCASWELPAAVLNAFLVVKAFGSADENSAGFMLCC